jgi:hypothetical protein
MDDAEKQITYLDSTTSRTLTKLHEGETQPLSSNPSKIMSNASNATCVNCKFMNSKTQDMQMNILQEKMILPLNV